MKMIFSIVPRNHAEPLHQAALSAGASGGTILIGRGTASNSLLQILGLGETAKDIFYTIVEDSRCAQVESAIDDYAKNRAHFGVRFAVRVMTFLKSGESAQSENQENSGMNTHQLVVAVLHKGAADEAMAAARHAGATGGTVLAARGTAKADDATFFGVHIVPEKDQLLILVENAKAEAVMQAIRNIPSLSKPGTGIVFALPVTDFASLGTNGSK